MSYDCHTCDFVCAVYRTVVQHGAQAALHEIQQRLVPDPWTFSHLSRYFPANTKLSWQMLYSPMDDAYHPTMDSTWGHEEVGIAGLTLQDIAEAFHATKYRKDIKISPLERRSHVPEYRHQQNLWGSPDANKLDEAQHTFQFAVKYLMVKKGASYETIRNALQHVDLSMFKEVRKLAPFCKKLYRAECDPHHAYRSFDGSCNNMEQPNWGRARTCMKRIMSPAYDDELGDPRARMKTGRRLPNPRLLSNVLATVEGPDVLLTHKYTHLFMIFGQMIAHDTTLTPITTKGPFDDLIANGTNIQCCPWGSATNVPACLPIYVEPTDPFFSKLNIDCINFVRSAGCTDCTISHREQTDQQTAFLDASNVYGASKTDLMNVRDPEDPALLALRPESGLLPVSLIPTSDGCSDLRRSKLCFRAGDRRVNQQPGITSMQTIFARQHNRLAHELKRVNPHWEGKKIFQEARSILIAQLQKIVYTEYLPIALGPHVMELYGLNIKGPEHRTQYDGFADPSMTTEFATAAFRFGHPLVHDFMSLNSHGKQRMLDLKDFFFDVFDFYKKGKLDDFLRGVSWQLGKAFGPSMVEDVKNFLYRNSSSFSGLDLASLNIQRGRDHGIPGYGHYLSWCSGKPVHNFEDLLPYMTKRSVDTLSKLYETPYDVDLWVGGLYEKPVKGGVVGSTFACLLGHQFRNMMYGDRYFFTHQQPTYAHIGFSDGQLSEIFRSSFAKIVCANVDRPSNMYVQKYLLLPAGEGNPWFPCKDLPDTDLTLWMDMVPNFSHEMHFKKK
ncbi:peroxidase-like [Ornithodoros turicata]|uniref:peroxidase-like n=1 Tax=Ornithodoros turicata TaxID=34597 RepID=UPI00313972F8